ncbi:hypothetical protein J5N97_019892 [Dioscorea zingiberensis]|uniref:C2H2-type domain-containing protein n=1 Tax=Dioscorea zingiberensis TaxID=325984 RepID=A0A9D5CFW2_9LILI|nr:hypothetical protein J5N97_019892 [Dioscorea zingiberensis]
MSARGDNSRFFLGKTEAMGLMVNQLSATFSEVIEGTTMETPIYINVPCNNFCNSSSADSTIVFVERNELIVSFGHFPQNNNNLRFMPTPTLTPSLSLNPSPAPSPIHLSPPSFNPVNPCLQRNPFITPMDPYRWPPSSFDRCTSSFVPFPQTDLHSLSNNANNMTLRPHIGLNQGAHNQTFNDLEMVLVEPQHYYTCNMCGMEFPTPQAYGGHMSSHSKKVKARYATGESSRASKKSKNFL